MNGYFSSLQKQDGPGSSHILNGLRSHPSFRIFVVGSLTAILALSIYLITLAPDITWSHFSSDGGELITAAVTLGIPHPPGYPTYVLLGKLISFLPIGTIAFRFNLFSALAASIAAGFVAVTALESVSENGSANSVALATGLTIAFAPLIWGQAAVAEVYTLNLALVSFFLWALLGHRSSLLTGVLLGLSITTHLTSLLLLPMAIVLTARGRRTHLIGGLFMGLSPLLLLPIFAKLGSPVIWGDTTNLRGWLWLISGQLYASNLSLPNSTEILFRLSSWSKVILNQFAIFGWLFIIIGIANNRQDPRKNVWLLISVLLYALFNFFYSTPDSFLILLPILLLLSPILAAGLSRVGPWSLLLPLVLLGVNFNHQNLREDQHVRPLVEELLEELPQEAVLLTPGDQSIFTLWYFKHVEGQRPDLRLVDSNLFAFDWYRKRLKISYPELKGLENDDLELFHSLNSRIRPFCTLSLQSPETVSCHHSSDPGHVKSTPIFAGWF